MIKNLGLNKILWMIIAVLSLIAALLGVVNPSIYNGLASNEVMPGVLSQDLMTILASITVIILVSIMKESDSKKQVVILGIIGYIFYAYGIYVIEIFYNSLYLLYMAIFGLSFYTLIFNVASVRQEMLQEVNIPKIIRNVSVGFSLFIPLLFYPMWISHLMPLMETGTKIENLYSIYILDMAFILPLFIVISIMALKNKGLGLLLIPTLFIKGFTLLFSVAVGTMLKPMYHQTGDVGEMMLYLSISFAFLILTVVYFRKLELRA
ncbi:MAG: hypothetical protein SCK28_14725 [Bacillota bacterium]|nr:hypothetical protein [Bacillota bacterium]